MKACRHLCLAVIALCLFQGCDRRQSDGHSTTPPAQGAASQAPPEASSDYSIQAEESTTGTTAPQPERDGDRPADDTQPNPAM